MLLTVIESEKGAITASSVNALAVANDLARESGLAVEGVTFAPADEITDDLADQGLSTLHVVDHERCREYAPECWGEALAALLRATSPEGVITAATERGNELMAQVAARADLPFAANCVAVTGGEQWHITRQRGGGVLLEDAELTAPTKLVTLAPGTSGSAEVSPSSGVTVDTFTPELDDALVSSTMVDRTAKEAGVSLASAPVVVSGGRGVGSAEGFATLEELAGLLGGAVGCSRVVTNNGWRPHSDQVGLTGTKIAPALYIACGISGASQHWVGCMDAKKILAINTDAEAPMVTRASYAVIGDVQEVLGAVLTEIRKRQEAA